MGGFIMDDIIKRIVAIDLELKERVEKANQKKTSATINANALKETIYQDYYKQQQATINERIAVLKNQNQQVLDTIQKQYLDTLKQLENQYLTNKEEWVQFIVERCIKI